MSENGSLPATFGESERWKGLGVSTWAASDNVSWDQSACGKRTLTFTASVDDVGYGKGNSHSRREEFRESEFEQAYHDNDLRRRSRFITQRSQSLVPAAKFTRESNDSIIKQRLQTIRFSQRRSTRGNKFHIQCFWNSRRKWGLFNYCSFFDEGSGLLFESFSDESPEIPSEDARALIKFINT